MSYKYKKGSTPEHMNTEGTNDDFMDRVKTQNSRSNQPKKTQGLSATAESITPAEGQVYDKLGPTSPYQRKLRETAGSWSMGIGPEKAGVKLDEVNKARADLKRRNRNSQ